MDGFHGANQKRYILKYLGLLVFLSGLIGCGGSEHEDLQAYVKTLEKNDNQVIPELRQVKSVPKIVYVADNLRDPFSPKSGLPVGPKPEDCHKADHARETLEEYSLDALRMVGTLKKEGKLWGILLDPNGSVHNVQVGNYVGKNNGRIRGITEGQILLTELVEDGLGKCGWIEREASLALAD